jgi:hypothetical protein
MPLLIILSIPIYFFKSINNCYQPFIPSCAFNFLGFQLLCYKHAIFLQFGQNLKDMTTQKAINGLLHGSPPTPQPHFVLVPFFAQGHIIPIVDLAHLLANHGAFITFITTPLNASRLGDVIQSTKDLQLSIRFLTLPFNCSQVGLPEGSENLDTLSAGLKQFDTFLEACLQLRDPLITHLKEHGPPPNCVISDLLQPWTGDVARTFGVPRFSFVGFCAFCHLCRYYLASFQLLLLISFIMSRSF